ncbi:Poly(ADP-ribose) glycohydrolase ARH3 [Amphibalanus amphitrite]|uniref:ADP-ribosylhydrolase ARH3 n=1 Tax=Amphibalanus amphitrite TaxID=1232801 RepID=A0A6A4XFK7_AMPAM|nr:Poly(ADP-ribose) glycohydrolase ARH3 [Amphibalanus amphitrite]
MAAPMKMVSFGASLGLSVARRVRYVVNVENNIGRNCHTIMDKALLASKFKGCMVGSLVGDCLGEPFEHDDWDELPNEAQLDDYIQQLIQSKVKVPYKPYTDDTAMTRCIANSFISKQAFDAKDMARRFTKEFFAEPRRGYGGSVPAVFGALRKSDFEQPFLPAREQFNGTGSYGNGGAMRVAPVALFCYNSTEALIDTARQSARITHAHREGYNGAILQCLAVHQALQADPAQPLDGARFISRLREHMERLEKCDEDEIVDAGRLEAPFQKVLTVAEELLRRSPPPARGSVVDLLGHDVTALSSVPTAIYCFLRALQPLPGIQTESGLVRAIQYAISLGGDTDTIASMAGAIADVCVLCIVFQTESGLVRAVQYAISLGGDTDTIASMAGAIAGAFYGMEAVPASLLKYCEKADEAVTMGEQLLDLLEQQPDR